MSSAIDRLTQLQHEINQRQTTDRLMFFENFGLHVEYYGLSWSNMVAPVFETLCLPEVASEIRSLTFHGPDEGANGTREWDFTPLLTREVTFSELQVLVIEPSPLEYHNATIIGSGYEEAGQLAGWLTKAPQLRRLTTPSAPDSRFFQVEHPTLWWLRIEAG